MWKAGRLGAKPRTRSQPSTFLDYIVNSGLGKPKAASGDVVPNSEPVNLGLLNEK